MGIIAIQPLIQLFKFQYLHKKHMKCALSTTQRKNRKQQIVGPIPPSRSISCLLPGERFSGLQPSRFHRAISIHSPGSRGVMFGLFFISLVNHIVSLILNEVKYSEFNCVWTTRRSTVRNSNCYSKSWRRTELITMFESCR